MTLGLRASTSNWLAAPRAHSCSRNARIARTAASVSGSYFFKPSCQFSTTVIGYDPLFHDIGVFVGDEGHSHDFGRGGSAGILQFTEVFEVRAKQPCYIAVNLAARNWTPFLDNACIRLRQNGS